MQVDRSPTGSGVTARIALQHHKGLIGLNQTRTFKSGTSGSEFTGKAVEVTLSAVIISATISCMRACYHIVCRPLSMGCLNC